MEPRGRCSADRQGQSPVPLRLTPVHAQTRMRGERWRGARRHEREAQGQAFRPDSWLLGRGTGREMDGKAMQDGEELGRGGRG